MTTFKLKRKTFAIPFKNAIASFGAIKKGAGFQQNAANFGKGMKNVANGLITKPLVATALVGTTAALGAKAIANQAGKQSDGSSYGSAINQ